MKQKLLLIFSTLLLSLLVKGQLLTESFDGATFPPSGWTTAQIGGGTNVWIRSTVTTQTNPNAIPPHSGAGMALYDAYNFLAGEAADLATPSLNFSTGGPYKVSFWMYRDQRYSSNNDSLEVFVNAASATSSGGTKLGVVWRHYLDPPIAAATGWYQYTFNIPGSFNTATNYIIFRANSDFGTEMIIDDVSVETNLSCSGTPVGGTAQASTSLLCSAGNVSLTLSGASTSPGITYQWQSSPAGANTFTDISGATGTAYTAAVSASTDYRCVVTCTNGGASVNSNTVTVTVSSAPPANDIVCGAIPLTVGGAYQCGNTTCATASGDPTLICSTPNNTVWYTYTPATSGVANIIIKRNGAGSSGQLDAWIQLYTATGSCPTLALTQVNTATCTGDVDLTAVDSGIVVTPSLTAGTTYYIMLDGVSGALGAYCIRVQPPPPPPPCVTNITPANGATNVSVNPSPTLSWNAAATATSYNIFFGTENPPTANVGNTSGTTVGINNLGYNTTYYWYVQPVNVGGVATGCATNVTSFTTGPVPVNCIPLTSSGCSLSDRISLFRLKGETSTLLINTGSACSSNAYVDTTDHPVVIDLARGKTYWGQTQAGTTGDYLSLWLDMNDNGFFEDNERLMNNLPMQSASPGNINLFIPLSTPGGNHTLRARLVYYGATPPTIPSDPCNPYNFSETEDYKVNITTGGSPYTVATYTPSGACYTGTGQITIDSASNNNLNFVPLVDSNNAIIAQLYPLGNNLGTVTTSYYKHNGPVRQDAGGRYYMDRNLTINVTRQPLIPYNLRFPYQNAELNALIAQPGSGITSQFDLVMTKNGDACLNAIGTGGTGGNVYFPTGFGGLSGDRFIDVTNITGGFSSFYLHGGSTPIPVTLSNFTVQRLSGRSNKVTWTTSQEINSSHFVIEHSTDGRNFAALTQVNAAGNSNTPREYVFTDNNPVRGINYYRLRMVDRDNSTKYSPIRSVRNEGTADITVYPNPVKDLMKLEINADKADRGQIIITDINGKMVFSRAITIVQGNNILPIDIGNMSNGAYIIKVQLTDDVVIRKFSKQ
jgi:hypothetical protein